MSAGIMMLETGTPMRATTGGTGAPMSAPAMVVRGMSGPTAPGTLTGVPTPLSGPATGDPRRGVQTGAPAMTATTALGPGGLTESTESLGMPLLGPAPMTAPPEVLLQSETSLAGPPAEQCPLSPQPRGS